MKIKQFFPEDQLTSKVDSKFPVSHILCFRGKDVVHQLTVTLEELHNGTTRKLALQKHVICSKCEGVGGKKPPEKCPSCRGTGMQVSYFHLKVPVN